MQLSGSRSPSKYLRYKPERRVVVAAHLSTTNGHRRSVLIRYTTAQHARPRWRALLSRSAGPGSTHPNRCCNSTTDGSRSMSSSTRRICAPLPPPDKPHPPTLRQRSSTSTQPRSRHRAVQQPMSSLRSTSAWRASHAGTSLLGKRASGSAVASPIRYLHHHATAFFSMVTSTTATS